MAFHDWNNNGKKDIADDFIEYQMYKQSTSNSNYTPRSSGGISTFGAIAATIGGLFLAAARISVRESFLNFIPIAPAIGTIVPWIYR